MSSNKLIAEEMQDDPDWENYVRENEGIIVKTKDEIVRIMVAFMKVGVNLDKEVLGKLKHKNLYLGEEEKEANG